MDGGFPRRTVAFPNATALWSPMSTTVLWVPFGGWFAYLGVGYPLAVVIYLVLMLVVSKNVFNDNGRRLCGIQRSESAGLQTLRGGSGYGGVIKRRLT